MAEKVCKCGVKKKNGYLYFIGKNGHVYETKMARGKKKGGGRKVICKCGVKKKKGYLYFLDKRGDVSCAKMVIGGRRKKRRR